LANPSPRNHVLRNVTIVRQGLRHPRMPVKPFRPVGQAASPAARWRAIQ
jgi:hypothetical protein